MKFVHALTPEEFSTLYLIFKEESDYYQVLLEAGDTVEITVKARNGREKKIKQVYSVSKLKRNKGS